MATRVEDRDVKPPTREDRDVTPPPGRGAPIPKRQDPGARARRKASTRADIGEPGTAAEVRQARGELGTSLRARARRKAATEAEIGEAPLSAIAAKKAAKDKRRDAAATDTGEARAEAVTKAKERYAKEQLLSRKEGLTERSRKILESGKPIREQEARVARLKKGEQLGNEKARATHFQTKQERLEIAKVRRDLITPVMARFGKSFVPGLLTAEDWHDLKGYEKAAYIAGDIGLTILYFVPVAGVVRAAYLARPAKATLGTFGRVPIPKGSQLVMTHPEVRLPSGKVVTPTYKPQTQVFKLKLQKGTRPMSRNEINAAIRRTGRRIDLPSGKTVEVMPGTDGRVAFNAKLPSGKVIKNADALEHYRVFKPSHPKGARQRYRYQHDVYFVNETPAGKLQIQGTRPMAQSYADVLKNKGIRVRPREYDRSPVVLGRTKGKLSEPWKIPSKPQGLEGGGGGRVATPSRATMTTEQLINELGLVKADAIATAPIPVFRPKPDGKRAPSPVTLPTTTPEVEPDTTPGGKPGGKPEGEPGKTPGVKPSGKPSVEPADAPVEGTAEKPADTPGDEPYKPPAPAPKPPPTPKPQPQPKPKPQPQPKPEKPPPGTKTPPEKPVIGTPDAPALKAGALAVFPVQDAPDIEKRAYLDKVPWLIARRRGALRGQSVWRVLSPGGVLVVVGKAPAGAKLAKGKGSVAKSATLIKGKPPTGAIRDDTGAVDDIIMIKGNKVVVKSVKDTAVRRHIPTKLTDRELGGGVVETKTGRGTKRHIKLM